DPVTPVDPVIPDTSTSVYDNGVTLDRGAKTLTFASLVVNGVTYTNTTFAITKQGDGYLLTAPDGKTLTVTGLKEANNTLVMQGSYGADNLFWSYNSAGAFTLASPDTKVISGDGQQKTVDGNSSAGAAGETGTIISGDKNKIDVPGDNSATGGGTATKVDGDGNEIANSGATSATGEGSTGVDVTGDKNKISNEGDSSATAGGTATKVTGDGNEIDSTGSTSAAGEGSTGVDVTGDKNKINNEGASSATDGATGTKVAGNGNEIDNTGSTSAAGAGSTGVDVTGDKNKINNEGESSITGGATGTNVSGDSNTVNQDGKMVVGELSTGLKVTGRGNIVNLTSDEITITGKQATGVIVAGDDNEVTLTGAMNVNTSATGLDVSGTSADVKLSGTVNVVANTEDSLSGPLRFADGLGYRGVVVSSQNDSAQNATNILVDGSINVKDNRTDPMAYPNSPADPVPFGRDMTGLDVSGAFNNVTVTGSISLDATPYHTELINNGTIKGATNTYQDHVKGLNVSGTNNTVVVKDGINLNSATETSDWVIAPDMVGIVAMGAGNQVTVQGASSLTSRSAGDGYMQFADVSGGSSLILDSGATLDILSENNANSAAIFGQSVSVTDAQSKFINKGNVKFTATGGASTTVVYNGNGAITENRGSMTLDTTPLSLPSGVGYTFVALAGEDNDTQLINTGEINVINDKKADKKANGNTSDFNPTGPQSFVAGMSVRSGAKASNSGTITATGGNTWAISARPNSIATNETDGKIVHNANSATQDLTLQCSIDKACLSAIGGGMIAAGVEGVATNNGTITVNDSGVGMYALDGGSVINKGTINLESTNGTTPAADTQLIGMAVTGGSSAINDTTGVININAENGQAFYSDGNVNNRIINRGQINLGTGVPETADNSADLETLELTDGADLGGTTLANSSIVASGSTVKNTGTVDGTSTLTVEGIYNNQTGAATSAPVTVNASGVVNNNGILNGGKYNAPTLKVTSGTLNNTGAINGLVKTSGSAKVKNSGMMNQGFDISGTTSLVNSGTVANGPTGSGGDTTLMYLRDSSVFTNDTAGTVTLNTVSNAMYLAGKSTFVNKGSVEMSQASNGGAINLNSGGGVVINQGTMTGNGATMVNVRSGGTASATTGWIWNQTGGVMDFTAGTGNNAVAINTTGSSGIKSLNDGTINLHGNGAIGMKGSNTSQLVNNG
ncbi:hypothetical protein C3436_27260, partial [Citrobacter amalonaticus]